MDQHFMWLCLDHVLKELIDSKNPDLFILQGEKGKGLRYQAIRNARKKINNITVFDWGGIDSIIREVEQTERSLNGDYTTIWKGNQSHPLSDLVHFMVQKVAVFIKMAFPQCSFSDHFVGHFTFIIHHQFQHLIVGFPWKHYLPSIQLK